MKSIYASEKILQPIVQAIHFRPLVEAYPVNEMEWTFSIDNDCRNLTVAITVMT